MHVFDCILIVNFAGNLVFFLLVKVSPILISAIFKFEVLKKNFIEFKNKFESLLNFLIYFYMVNYFFK